MTVTGARPKQQTQQVQQPQPKVSLGGPRAPSLDDAASNKALIQQGQSGDSVKQLQEQLKAQGFPVTVDGKFGPETEKAVREFQAKKGIATDGLVGPDTVACLRGQTPPSQLRDLSTQVGMGPLNGRAPTEADLRNAPPGTIRADQLTSASRIRGDANADASNPASIARGYLGKRSDALQKNSDLHMDKWVPANKDCANFVSACLEKSGKISPSDHNDSVVGLRRNLIKDGYREVPLSEAKPGDVAIFDGPGGKAQHVELVDSNTNGKPSYIGSNNVNADGTQSITRDSGKWAHQIHIYQKIE